LGTSVMAVAALLAAACSGGDGGSAGGNGGSGGGERIVITARDSTFEPAQVTVPQGKTVTLVLKNEGAAVHNLRLETKEAAGKDFASDPMVNPGASSEIQVKIDRPGTYRFVCDYHLPGMVGELTVR
ncbi:MAG TPA: cupredoxin domain-containing protein, partial [Dehalococcoidia bacterium]